MESFTKKPGEVIILDFDFARDLETVWRPGARITLADFRAPTRPNGFEFEATTAAAGAKTAADEPAWPLTVAATVVDGSVTWTTRIGNNASDSISTRTVTADIGITIDSSSISGVSILVTVSGGTHAEKYFIKVRIVTAGGETIDKELCVRVAEERRC